MFDQDLSAWTVSRVDDMSYLFYGAESFNQDVSTWNVSNVEDMSFLFARSLSFNQNLCTWGPNLLRLSSVDDMFSTSGCPSQADPILDSFLVSPLCWRCK